MAENKTNVVENKVEKVEAEKKNHGVISIFTKEYKYENLILLLFSVIGIVLGVLVLIGHYSNSENGLRVREDVWLIGRYPTAFAWILVILGATSLLLSVWPFFKPSIYELRRVSWPDRGTLVRNTLTVFAFVLIMALFFMLVDSVLGYAIDWLGDLANWFRTL